MSTPFDCAGSNEIAMLSIGVEWITGQHVENWDIIVLGQVLLEGLDKGGICQSNDGLFGHLQELVEPFAKDMPYRKHSFHRRNCKDSCNVKVSNSFSKPDPCPNVLKRLPSVKWRGTNVQHHNAVDDDKATLGLSQKDCKKDTWQQ
ncbi:hypothetical protein Leryth_003628 [Lithospermum erythrorhizon]|nr:hypothetical protein Leryth_003628 [Lithospermum erythrorhizon]